MGALPYNFMIFQLIGLWRPVHWTPGWKTNLYNSYTLFVVLFVSSITLFEFVDLVGSIDDLETFATNSFILLTMVGVCGKAATFLKKRRELIELTNVLKNYPCLPQNSEELAIQRETDRFTRSDIDAFWKGGSLLVYLSWTVRNAVSRVTSGYHHHHHFFFLSWVSQRFNILRYAALTGAAVVAVVISSILRDIPRQTLPFNIWLPYDRSSSIGFWIAYLHQILAHVAGASINVAYDTIVPGLMLETCGQLRILKRRIKKVSDRVEVVQNHDLEKSYRMYDNGVAKALAECVKHHLVIFRLDNLL